MGTTAVDRKNRIGRRERREILKSAQDRGDGVVAVDKCQLEPLRPNTILRMLEVLRSPRRTFLGFSQRAVTLPPPGTSSPSL